MKVGIIGTGAYGTALALTFYENNNEVCMWTKFSEERDLLLSKRENEKALKNVHIDNGIEITCDLKKCILDKDIIVIAVPAKVVDDVASEIASFKKKVGHICVASKGIEQDTCLFIVDVIKKYIDTDKIAVISGPSFAIDIVSKMPIGLTLATTNNDTGLIIKEALENDYFKLRITDDIIGTEICGSIKNVIAIASGILEGLGANESTKAMFITESLHDIKSLIKSLGGNPKTILSFAGFGDLLLTSTSIKSRNYRYGKLIGQKASSEVLANYVDNNTIEGLYTLKSIYKLLNNENVDMPIIDLVYDIVFKGKNPEELFKFLIEKS